MRNVTQAGLDLIKESEGYRRFAYPDIASPLYRAAPNRNWGFENAIDILHSLLPDNLALLDGSPWTVGYGATTHLDGRPVEPGDEMTEDEAEDRLRAHVTEFSMLLEQALDVWINDEMFDALVSLLYNVGPGAEGVRDGIITLKSGKPSTLLAKLNAHDYLGAAEEFGRWNKAGGRENSGLVVRRNKEQALFNLGMDKTLQLYADYLNRERGEA
jgi:lysozyme